MKCRPGICADIGRRRSNLKQPAARYQCALTADARTVQRVRYGLFRSGARADAQAEPTGEVVQCVHCGASLRLRCGALLAPHWAHHPGEACSPNRRSHSRANQPVLFDANTVVERSPRQLQPWIRTDQAAGQLVLPLDALQVSQPSTRAQSMSARLWGWVARRPRWNGLRRRRRR